MPIGSNWFGDDHPYDAVYRSEHEGVHFQVTAQEAAERAWYYRPVWYGNLVPDTRKCRCHGEILFDPLPLTAEEQKIRSPMSTDVLLHERGF